MDKQRLLDLGTWKGVHIYKLPKETLLEIIEDLQGLLSDPLEDPRHAAEELFKK